MGGCFSANNANDDAKLKAMTPEERKKEEEARKQRRRLSVSPEHVGDVSKDGPKDIADHKTEVTSSEAKKSEIQGHGLIHHAVLSKKGFVPYNRNKVNQDREIVVYGLQNDPSMALFGVMDGHGECGHDVAQFVKNRLPQYLTKQENLKADTPSAITRAVKELVDELLTSNINIAFSGTTAVFAVLVEKTVFVANIGDSRCVLCRKTADGSIEALPLSIDQKPELPEEKARIIKAGGRVEPLPGPPGEDCGPPRVWLADVDVPGLAMSRSIGDEVSQTVGVISVPVVTPHQIEDSDMFLVFASDGVWEFIPNIEACRIVHQNVKDLSVATEKLVAEAHDRWTKQEEVIDDITCIICTFNH